MNSDDFTKGDSLSPRVQPSYAGHQQAVLSEDELDAPPSYEASQQTPSRAGGAHTVASSSAGIVTPPSTVAQAPSTTPSSDSSAAGSDVPLQTSTTRASGVETRPYSSQQNKMSYEMDPKVRERLLSSPGCCFSTTGGCCFSTMGGCCFSDNEACCWSDHAACCWSDNKACCFSDHEACCFSDNKGCCFSEGH
ncbi:hypothetical protein GQ53DRAFT_824493 [Thozetella sp. PMI_491]|nr:hypothetical protein GQ53DRAFT_824493 [Thozetella sp. PMI_491]